MWILLWSLERVYVEFAREDFKKHLLIGNLPSSEYDEKTQVANQRASMTDSAAKKTKSPER